MRIGISTIIDYYNYGNRLQNYALQQILEEMGHEVETIRNFYQGNSNNKLFKVVSEIKKGSLFYDLSN